MVERFSCVHNKKTPDKFKNHTILGATKEQLEAVNNGITERKEALVSEWSLSFSLDTEGQEWASTINRDPLGR